MQSFLWQSCFWRQETAARYTQICKGSRCHAGKRFIWVKPGRYSWVAKESGCYMRIEKKAVCFKIMSILLSLVIAAGIMFERRVCKEKRVYSKMEKTKKDGYEIAFSTSSKFPKKKTEIIKIKGNVKVSKTVSKLKAKK